MRKLSPLLVALPALALGGLLTASLTTTARAQAETPAERHVARTAEWEYRYYFCGNDDPCAQDGGKGAYEELDKLGADGWEAYAYSVGKGFNWELKRRK